MDLLQKTAEPIMDAIPMLSELPVRTATTAFEQPTQALPVVPVETKSNNTLYYVLGALGLVALFSMSKKSKGAKKTTKK